MENNFDSKCEFYAKFTKLQGASSIKKEKHNGVSFKSRSLEMILEHIKPTLNDLGLYVVFSNDIAVFNDDSFVVSTVTIGDFHGNKIESTSKVLIPRYNKGEKRLIGMQDPQVSGACQSYANKYSLQNLLAIDDNEDIDRTPNVENKQNSYAKKNNNQQSSSVKSESDVVKTQFSKALNFAKTIKANIEGGLALSDKESDWFVKACDTNIDYFQSENPIDHINELIKFYEEKLK